MKSFGTLPFLLCLAWAPFALLPMPVLADGPALDVQSTTGGQNLNNGSFSLGWTFSVTDSVTVTALGFYDADQNGLSTTHAVGIFDESCSPVAVATVEPSDTLVGFFRYHELSASVILSPGQTYSIAAVTGGEPYLYSPTSVALDPKVVFGKFTAWQAALQQTSTLQCPNFPSTTQFYGDFGPSFYIGAQSGAPSKRDTALTIFCNRTGADLLTATCSATVADQGPPQRSLPTGLISWESRDGLSPATAQCAPQQVSGSPGIGACQATFVLPSGFPIGVKFPIDASYSGDDVFNASSTSHSLIVATCSGEDCPDAVGLTFEEFPSILQNKLLAYINCGAGESSQSVRAFGVGDRIPAGSCTVVTSANLDVESFISDLTYEDAVTIGAAIKDADAQKDTLLYYLKKASTVEEAARWDTLRQTQEAIIQMSRDVVTNRVEVRKKTNPYEDFFRGSPQPVMRALSQKKSFDKKLATAKVRKVVQPDHLGKIALKLPSRLKKLQTYLKTAGYGGMPMEVTMTAKQKLRKGTATVTQTVSCVLR